MKIKFLILILMTCIKFKVSCQSNGDIKGIWEVYPRDFLVIDTTFIADSLGNATYQIASMDTIAIRGNKLERSTWFFNDHKLVIKSEKLPGRYYTQFFQFQFLESGLLLTSNSGQKKYYIEEITPEKLVLIDSRKNNYQAIIELRKNE